VPLNSPSLLNSLEVCQKQASLYAQGLERESLTFHQLLIRGVMHGLECDADDPGKASSDEVMRLCWSRPIETEQSDLIGLAEHVASLAEIIVWCLRTGPAWVHPKPLPNWQPSSWVIHGGLRRVALVDHWSDRRALQEARDWQTLEGALYGLPMTILAVVLGSMRDGRRHGPLTRGWLHPRSGELRFRKRDGNSFDGNWEPAWREQYDDSREDWIEAMNADGVMTETFLIQPPVEFDAEETRSIAEAAKEGIASVIHPGTTPPRRNLSRCFDSLRPCEFRHPCAYFKEPTEGKGFVKIEELLTAGSSPSNVQKQWRPHR